MNERAPVCITGMHRSGTSLLALLLHGCGLNLGRESELIPPTRDNPDGHWEHREFVAVNDALLAALGGGWDLPPELPARWTQRPEIAPLKAHARKLIAGFPADRVWGWKDPRTSLTLGFWREVLPALKTILCVRHPVEVALSLRRRGLSSYAFGYALWLRHQRQALADTDGAARLITHYDAFFHRPEAELRRVLRFAGIEAEEAAIAACAQRIKSDARHQRAGAVPADAPALPDEVRAMYAELCVAAEWEGKSGIAALPHTAPKPTPEAETEMLRKRLWDAEAALTEQAADAGRERAGIERALLEEREAAAHVRAILRGAQPNLGPADAGLLDYEDMLERIRNEVEEHVPRGATMLVVSKGDERLVQFADRRARHFPADADGASCGHHPTDDAEALAWLAAARAAGAEFLVFPASSSWWLSHYKRLFDHLSESASLIRDRDDTCKIFALRKS